MKNEDLQNPSLADKSLQVILHEIKSLHARESAVDSSIPPWVEVEPEVWVDALTVNTPLSADQLQRLAIKISLLIKLHVSEDSPEFEDVLYDPILILKLAETLNNVDIHLIDGDSTPSLTSMEMAWFIDEIKRVMALPDLSLKLISKEVRQVCAYVLHEEGCPIPPYPFSLFLQVGDLHKHWNEGEVPDLTESNLTMVNRTKAIDIYLNLMRKHLC